MIQMLSDNTELYFYQLYMEEKGINLTPNHVSQTTFWLLDDEEYIGTFALRHDLTEQLKEIGGHIVYQIKPSKQKQGYATKGLLLCLNEALRSGLEQILITCKEKILSVCHQLSYYFKVLSILTTKKPPVKGGPKWSGRLDSNQRLLAPHASALPG